MLSIKSLIKNFRFKKTGGSNIYQNIFAMLCMSFFVLAITDLWSILADKDPEVYRFYCIISFAFWWTFSKSIYFQEKKFLNFLIKYCFHYLFFFIVSVILNTLVMSLFHDVNFNSIYKASKYVFILLILLLPLNLFISVISKINFYISSILGTIKRIWFFLTPIIWIPIPTMEAKINLIKNVNPLYNISDILKIDEKNELELIVNLVDKLTFFTLIIYLILIFIIVFLFKHTSKKKIKNKIMDEVI